MIDLSSDYKKGSLIIHGYKSDEDVAQYKCMLNYVDYAAWLSAKQKTGSPVSAELNSYLRTIWAHEQF